MSTTTAVFFSQPTWCYPRTRISLPDGENA